jgi:enterochelin esterase family protein
LKNQGKTNSFAIYSFKIKSQSLKNPVERKASDPWIRHSIEEIHSIPLKREVKIDIFLPPDYDAGKGPYPLLLLNDGQDSETMGIQDTLAKLYSEGKINPVIVVGIYAGDRMQEYGVAGIPDFKKRGAHAKLYTRFIIDDLLPYLFYRYSVHLEHGENVFAGYSLGGLSAIDIAWNNPLIFKKAAAFSGAFWWRKRDLNAGYTEKDRIIHAMIRKSKPRPGMKFWFQAGTLDEHADRNKNGIIDAIDDTLDLISELIIKGYKPYYDVSYHEVEGGKHNLETWANVFPEFMIWAFGK